MIHTDGMPTIANGAGDREGKSWKLRELEQKRDKLLADLERVNDDIALVVWADGQAS